MMTFENVTFHEYLVWFWVTIATSYHSSTRCTLPLTGFMKLLGHWTWLMEIFCKSETSYVYLKFLTLYFDTWQITESLGLMILWNPLPSIWLILKQWILLYRRPPSTLFDTNKWKDIFHKKKANIISFRNYPTINTIQNAIQAHLITV